MEQDGTYSWAPSKPPKKSPNFKKAGRIVTIVVLVVIAALLIGTCYYTVDDKQQAVVTTFGKVTDITDAGVHFKLPLGIQQVQKVDVNVYQKIELGYSSSGNDYLVNDRESTMITGDYNIVNVDFFVEYKISDPVQYLYSSNNPELILRNLIQSQVRNVVGSSTVDAVLTDGKENIQMQVKELVTRILQEYDIGLTLVDVKIQDAEPPTTKPSRPWKPPSRRPRPSSTTLRPTRTPSFPRPRPRRTSWCRTRSTCGRSESTRLWKRWPCSRPSTQSTPRTRTSPGPGCTTRPFPTFFPV